MSDHSTHAAWFDPRDITSQPGPTISSHAVHSAVYSTVSQCASRQEQQHHLTSGRQHVHPPRRTTLDYLDLSSQRPVATPSGTDDSDIWSTGFTSGISDAPIHPDGNLAAHALAHDDYEEGEAEDNDTTGTQSDSKPDTLGRSGRKKRMTRFRLTHNQTRFLLNEFARQPNPDTAHRERLAREIPGLSPRQVQVWFQNRRAKMKRLPVDDRERVLASRTLPDDFHLPTLSRCSSAPNDSSAFEARTAANLGTSIRAMDDLKRSFTMVGAESISEEDDRRRKQQIQSVISQSTYPLPLLATEGIPTRPHQQRPAAAQQADANERTSSRIEDRAADNTATTAQLELRQGLRQRSAMIFGRRVSYFVEEDSPEASEVGGLADDPSNDESAHAQDIDKLPNLRI